MGIELAVEENDVMRWSMSCVWEEPADVSLSLSLSLSLCVCVLCAVSFGQFPRKFQLILYLISEDAFNDYNIHSSLLNNLLVKRLTYSE